LGDESPDESHAHLYIQFCSHNCQEDIAAIAIRKRERERERREKEGRGEKEEWRGKGREKRKEGGRKEEKKEYWGCTSKLILLQAIAHHITKIDFTTTNRFHRAHPCLTYAVGTGRTIKIASVILENKA